MKKFDTADATQVTLEAGDEVGATAVEYGLMVALIAATILAAVTLLGDNMSAMYDLIANTV